MEQNFADEHALNVTAPRLDLAALKVHCVVN